MMGINMHAYIEMSDSLDDQELEENDTFSQFSGYIPFNHGPFHSTNNSQLFDALGDGGRPFYEEKDWGKPALYSPRGIPENISFDLADQYAHRVVIKGDIFEFNYFNYRRLPAVSLQRAEEWVSEGISQFIEIKAPSFSSHVKYDGRFVICPDYMNASWLLLPEIYESLEHHDIRIDELNEHDREMFPTIIEIMESLERKLGEGRTRLVFWFTG